MSEEFASKKDSQSTKLEPTSSVFLKPSFRELCNSKLTDLHAFDSIATGFPILEGHRGAPLPSYNFFQTHSPPLKLMPPMDHPPLKNEASPTEKQTPIEKRIPLPRNNS